MNTEIDLSMEIPTRYIERFGVFEDLGFCIAPYVLSDGEYAYQYCQRLMAGQNVIMDNGAYELGGAIDIKAILEAAERINCGWAYPGLIIIAPDHPTDKEATIRSTMEFRDKLAGEAISPTIRIAAVVQGNNPKEQTDCYNYFVRQGFGYICLSFLWDRPKLLSLKPNWHPHIRHHLLGCYGLDEIRWMRAYATLPPNASIDTVKPLKAALAGKYLIDHVRGGGKWDHNIVLDEEQERRYRINCAALYTACHTYISHDECSPIYNRPTDTYSDARGIKEAV